MSVAGPYVARHPSPLRRPSKVQSRHSSSSYQSSTAQPPPSDPYYGHADISHLCQRFIQALFACPTRPPASSNSPSSPTPSLAVFVAYALHRTRLHVSVTFTALFLLSRLKSRFPAARGSSGHRLFISAFMIASKVVCDDTYSNKSWTVVGQGMFSLREINQMEREMCGYLEWVLNVDPKELREFEAKVRKDYALNGPCPAFVHPPQPAPSPGSTPPVSGTDDTNHHQLQNAISNTVFSMPPSSTDPSPLATPPMSPPRTSRAVAQGPPPAPTYIQIPPIDARPPTPPLGSHDDNSPSPASSATCLTPQSDDDQDDATIVSTGMGMSNEMAAEAGGPTRTNSAMSMMSVASLPPKSKMGRDPSFAFPSRTVW